MVRSSNCPQYFFKYDFRSDFQTVGQALLMITSTATATATHDSRAFPPMLGSCALRRDARIHLTRHRLPQEVFRGSPKDTDARHWSVSRSVWVIGAGLVDPPLLPPLQGAGVVGGRNRGWSLPSPPNSFRAPLPAWVVPGAGGRHARRLLCTRGPVPRDRAILSDTNLRAWLKPGVARHQMPQLIEFVTKLPVTPLGKRDRRAQWFADP